MWFWFALASAFISGISVTFNKRVLNRGVHSSVVAFALFFVLTVTSIPLFIANVDVKTTPTFYTMALGSAFVFAIAKIIALNTFKHNNLTDYYPLAAMAPVTLYIMSVVFLSENIKTAAFFGILLMAMGVYILNFDKSNKNFLHPFVSFFKSKYSMLFTIGILLANLSSIFEKKALLSTEGGDIIPLAFWENLFLSILTGIYVVKTNRSWLDEIRKNLLSLGLAGIIFSVLYYLVMSGFSTGPVSLISAVKKLEVLIVIILSYLIFGERPTKKVYVAATIMLIAVYLIKS